MNTRMLELSRELFCIASPAGKLTYVNDAWHQTLGWTVEELTSRPFMELVHPDDQAGTMAELERLATGTVTVDFTNRYRHADGRYHCIVWQATADPITGELLCAARDAHELSALDKQLHTRKTLLHEEQQRINGQLHDSAVQHGIASLMYLDASRLESSPEATQELLDRARLQMVASIDAMRVVVRGAEPALRPATDLAEDIRALGTQIVDQFGIAVETTVDVTESTDELVASLLYRIAREGLVNAAKHGYASVARVRIEAAAGKLCLSVTDDGCGPDAAPLGSTERRGLGMGLPMLRTEVQRMGGTLLLSPSNDGTRLEACLPL